MTTANVLKDIARTKLEGTVKYLDVIDGCPACKQPLTEKPFRISIDDCKQINQPYRVGEQWKRHKAYCDNCGETQYRIVLSSVPSENQG